MNALVHFAAYIHTVEGSGFYIHTVEGSEFLGGHLHAGSFVIFKLMNVTLLCCVEGGTPPITHWILLPWCVKPDYIFFNEMKLLCGFGSNFY